MRLNRVPVATYRLQLNADFRFEDARRIAGYLAALGVTELYSSPILTARRGSSHGYDITDPERLNPELGSEDQFNALSDELKRHGLGLVLDIVPNHMAATTENPWWLSVLELGADSEFGNFFDVDWEPFSAFGALRNRVLLPILGKPYGEVLEGAELKLAFAAGVFTIHYYEHLLPVTPRSYHFILEKMVRSGDAGDAWTARLRELLKPWDELSPEQVRERASELKARLAELHETEAEFRNALARTVAEMNGEAGDLRSFDALDDLLESQFYRLSYWRMASEEINYRRFFDVTDLIGLRIEQPEVFERRHRKLLEMIERNSVTGLRVDHIDGLYDPVAGLRRMQERIGQQRGVQDERFYVVVEKILGEHEEMPETFAADGTTGYDFLNVNDGVFVDGEQLGRLGSIYETFIGDTAPYEELVLRSKSEVIEWLFAGEMRALAAELSRLAQQDRNARDFSPNEVLQALTAVTVGLDRYRTYIRDANITPADREALERAVNLAVARNGGRLDPRLFEFIRRVFSLDLPYYAESHRGEWLRFVMRWQQFTGRAMAKGVEDTAFYRYQRLISLNEVGGEPGVEGPVDVVERFHLFNERMAAHWPLTMNSSSTHDTKRSEDMRARINVLSEIPETWERSVRSWARLNFKAKVKLGQRIAPSRSEEFMLYQTLIGVWPLEASEVGTLTERLNLFTQKALREAKTNSSWLTPDEEYEKAVSTWIADIIRDETSEFRREFDQLRASVEHYGFLNSLSQLVLKVGSPGVPDFYQGQELWDFSLVDPDNRRPVDYELRRSLLEGLPEATPGELLENWRDGRVKLFTTARALRFRQELRALFTSSSYVRLTASGGADRHVCAFARHSEAGGLIVVVPRLLATLVAPGEMPLGDVWSEESLEVAIPGGRWRNRFTEEVVETFASGAGMQRLRLKEVFATFPVALLERME